MGETLRIGMIGCDTSHCVAFTRLLADEKDPYHVEGGRVIAVYPSFSEDIESSRNRVDGYTSELRRQWGVEIVDSIDALLRRCDAILLESNDGRRHLPEVRPVIKARIPVFIDKPLTASLADAKEIARLAAAAGAGCFSSSSLRFDANIARCAADPDKGTVVCCDAFSSCPLEPTNPGFYWYGIHGVEILYTFMGAGCESVRCVSTAGADLAVGFWPDGRIGTMRGIREGAATFGGTIVGEKKLVHVTYNKEIPIYAQLLKQIIPFFRGAPAPVALSETVEIMAFIEAAWRSSRQGGAEVRLDT